METVTLSQDFQVTIPRAICEMLQLNPGTQLHVLEHDGKVEFIPVSAMREMRGFLRGMDTTIERDEDRL